MKSDRSSSQPGGAGESPGVVVAGLSRDLGLVSALAIGTGTMIAAGIFTLSGLAVGYVGSAAIVSFLLAAVVAAFTALTYCEFTSIYPFSGEGYLYARKTFPPLLAYLVGWCILLGYASSCAFYIASLSSYFNEFIWHVAVPALPGLVFLAALTLLNIKGTKESGTFQIVVTAAKIILLVWFIAGGLGSFDTVAITERFSRDIPHIASTAALVFITFFGFSAIAASAGEVMNPTKTIPRAIFISMVVVTVLYSLVVLVVVVADLNEYTEAAMGVAARAFLGPVGGAVIVGGAIFSMISASNASIMAGSRVALSMSQLRHLPRFFGRIGARTRTPFVAVLAAGGSIGIFALLLPLESLAHFANLVLLLALCLVNAALIVHRRRFPDIERPFRVPLVPLLPALGIAANVYLILQIPMQGHIQPVVFAILALAAGLFAYAAWRGTRSDLPDPAGPGSRVVVLSASPRTAPFRILLPVHNPQTAEPLVRLGGGGGRPPPPGGGGGAGGRGGHRAARGPGSRPAATRDGAAGDRGGGGDVAAPAGPGGRSGRTRHDRGARWPKRWPCHSGGPARGPLPPGHPRLEGLHDHRAPDPRRGNRRRGAPGAGGHHAGQVRARATGAAPDPASECRGRACAQGAGLRASHDRCGRG